MKKPKLRDPIIIPNQWKYAPSIWNDNGKEWEERKKEDRLRKLKALKNK
jgi:hypothetical protein